MSKESPATAGIQERKLDKRFKVVLIALYGFDSLGIRLLHSILAKKGVDVTSIFFKEAPTNYTSAATEAEKLKLIELVKSLKPDLVGMSVRSSFYRLAREMTNRIKETAGGPQVIWGGTHATVMPEDCINIADIVCVGEGEGALSELTTGLANGGDITKIPNLWIKSGGNIVKNDLRPLVTELDALPFPDFTDDNKYYIENDAVMTESGERNKGFYVLMTARGCPYQCTYCSNNILKRVYEGKGPYVRRRSVKSCIDELVEVKRKFKGLNCIIIGDDIFTLDSKWVSEFCSEYKQKIRIPFVCEYHPAYVRDEEVGLLRETGLFSISMGIQSGSQRTRQQVFERYDNNEKIKAAANTFHKHGIIGMYDIILDDPFETAEDKQQTLDLLLSFERPFNLNLFSLCYFPKTKLTERALREGIITPDDVEGVSEKAINNYAMNFERPNLKPEDLFYDSLIYLSQKKFAPQTLIRALSRNPILKRYPLLIAFPLKMGVRLMRVARKMRGRLYSIPTPLRKQESVSTWD